MKSAWLKFVRFFDATDLTKGDIKKDILRFLGPIVLSLLFQQIYTLVDAIIIGQTLGPSEVAGVNNSTNIVFLIVYFAMGAASGFSVVIGDLAGKKDQAGVRRCTMNQIYLSLIISVVLTVMGCLLVNPLLALIDIVPSAPGSVLQAEYEAASLYLYIIIGGTATQMFYNHIVGTLRAIGDSFTPFMFLLASTVLNIGLDCLFIIAFNWGVAGAAAATLIAQGLAALLCYIYAYVKYPMYRPRKEDCVWDSKLIFESLRNGLPMAFNFSVLAIGIIIMQGAVDRFDIIGTTGELVDGLPAQLGYGAACKIINLLMAPINALGTAMISFHAQNLGAKDLDRIKKGFKFSILFGFVIYFFVLALGLLFTIGGSYQYLFLGKDKISEASIKYGNVYIYTAMPFFFVLMFLYIFRNTLQGLQQPLFPFLAGVGELIARVTICLFIPALLNGGMPTNSSSPIIAYVGAVSGDPGAWLIASLIMVYSACHAIYGKRNAVVREEERLQREMAHKEKVNQGSAK